MNALTFPGFSQLTTLNVAGHFEAVLGAIQTKSWCCYLKTQRASYGNPLLTPPGEKCWQARQNILSSGTRGYSFDSVSMCDYFKGGCGCEASLNGGTKAVIAPVRSYSLHTISPWSLYRT